MGLDKYMQGRMQLCERALKFSKLRIEGLVCPPFTPYKADGSVNLEVLPKQIDIIKKTGVAGVFLGGTGSEGASQLPEERLAIARAYKEHMGDAKLILHVGATSLEESRKLAAAAEEMGVDAVASVTPTFFKPGNLAAMTSWLQGVAEAAPNTPFYYYHIPSITGVPATISVKKFLEEGGRQIPTLHGVKYTSMNLCEYADAVGVGKGRYDVLAGYSEQMLAALAMGARASVSVPFNLPFAMERYHRILSLFSSGNLEEALKEQRSINRLTYLLQFGGHGAAIPVMRAMFHMETGIDLGPPRLPLQPISQDAYAAVLADLQSLEFL